MSQIQLLLLVLFDSKNKKEKRREEERREENRGKKRVSEGKQKDDTKSDIHRTGLLHYQQIYIYKQKSN